MSLGEGEEGVVVVLAGGEEEVEVGGGEGEGDVADGVGHGRDSNISREGGPPRMRGHPNADKHGSAGSLRLTRKQQGLDEGGCGDVYPHGIVSRVVDRLKTDDRRRF